MKDKPCFPKHKISFLIKAEIEISVTPFLSTHR